LRHGEYQTVDADRVVANARAVRSELWQRL
jgi:hypothetical protein